jgi:hypothetical protein
MTEWDIEPDEVYGRYMASHALMEDLTTEVAEYSERFQDAEAAVGWLLVGGEEVAGSVLALALLNYQNYAARRIAYLIERRNACWSGAVEATHAYAEGDFAMAAAAQRQDLWLAPDSPLLNDYGPR